MFVCVRVCALPDSAHTHRLCPSALAHSLRELHTVRSELVHMKLLNTGHSEIQSLVCTELQFLCPTPV